MTTNRARRATSLLVTATLALTAVACSAGNSSSEGASSTDQPSATTARDGTPSSTTAGVGPTTTPTTPSTAAASPLTTPVGGDFSVVDGTSNIDGIQEPSVDVQARPGSAGSVSVPIQKILNVVIPGQNWELTGEPDKALFDFIDDDSIPDGDEDPYPEPGGATFITLRPLAAGMTTITVRNEDNAEAVVVTVTAS